MDFFKVKKSYINKKGYVINKKDYNPKLIDEIKKELTVTPNINEDYGVKAIPYKVYLEGPNKLYLPKYYAIKKLGPAKSKIFEGYDIDVSFNGSIREGQKEAVERTLNQMYTKGGGLLSLPCGKGKTVISLYILSQLKKKTLVIVNQEFLMDQWIERINMFLPDMRVGKVQRDKVQVEGYDISLAMLKSLSKRDYGKDAFKNIGFVIVDECHNVATKEYSKALQKICSKYMLGLSATPTRKDGLTKVIKWFIGDLFMKSIDERKLEVSVERYIMNYDDARYNKVLLNYRQKPFIAKMITNIAEYIPRNDFIIDRIYDILKIKDAQVLILSERLSQLKYIYEKINDKELVGYFVGKMKAHEREESMTKRVILGTFHIAREALDIKTLNTLILATPKSDIVQAVGRIMRTNYGNHLIIDIIDNFSSFARQSKIRQKLYKNRDYDIKTFMVSPDNIIDKDDFINDKKSIKIDYSKSLF